MMALSSWLDNPVRVSAGFGSSADETAKTSQLDACAKQILSTLDFQRLFPVQDAVLEYSLKHDICVSAPTGSGKTLAYILPILKSLHRRRVIRIRGLVVVPGRELALQIQGILEPLANGLGLCVGLAVGQSSVSAEAKKFDRLDILLATPGRLLDHLEMHPGLLQHLEWLVLDEADRLLEGFTADWVSAIFNSISHADGHSDNGNGVKTHRSVDTAPEQGTSWVTPLRKMLFSATLTRNPAKLAELALNDPVYIIATHENIMENDVKYITPKELAEYLWIGEEERKPVPLIHLLDYCNLTRAICFTRSIGSTEKLRTLLTRTCPSKRIAAYSAVLSSTERSKLLSSFNEGHFDLLICSDAAARGLDLSNVQAVINYDAPKYVKTYVHRVGRTARVGKSGLAYTLLSIKEAHHFKEMMVKAGKSKIPSLRIPKSHLMEIVPLLEKVLEQ